MNQELRQQIIELFNLEALNPDQQEDMIMKLGELVFQGALTRALADMNEEDQAAVENAIDDNTTPDQMMEVLVDKVPNFMELVAEELVNLKQHADAVVGKNTDSAPAGE